MRLRLCVSALVLGGLLVLGGGGVTACSDESGGTSSGGISTERDAAIGTSEAGAGSDAGGIDDANRIPCAPRAVLEAVCQQCHGRPTNNGAPFPIQRLSDLRANYLGRDTRLDMIDVLTAGVMPQAPVTISARDKQTLLDWLRAGAEGVEPQSCLVQPDAGPEDAGDAGDAH